VTVQGTARRDQAAATRSGRCGLVFQPESVAL